MNNITIELSNEDRARIDKLITALENVTPKLTITKLNEGDPGYTPHEEKAPTPKKVSTASDAVQAMTDFVQEPEKTAQDAQEETHPLQPTAPWDEQPATAEKTAPAEQPAPAVTIEQIQQKVMQLAVADGGAKKAQVREIVNAYAKKVSDIPEDKWAEVWGKLTALEG